MSLQRRDGSGCGPRVDTPPRPDPSNETAGAAEAPRVSLQPVRPVAHVADADACTLCGSCVDACVRGAVSSNGTVVIDARLCTGCGACVEACPQGVLELVEA